MSVFKITRPSAIKALEEMGYKNAKNYKTPRLTDKLSGYLDTEPERINSVQSPHIKRLLTTLAQALARGDVLEVIRDDKLASQATQLAPAGRLVAVGGVIGTIIQCLRKATYEHPITKREILDVLVEKFPERERESMATTIDKQLPSVLKRNGYPVQKSPRGFWLERVG